MADNYQIDLTLEEIFGTGISSIEQTTVSTIPGGANVWTVTLTNGNSYDFTVLNGTAGGDPIPALTGSAMTDTSAVYLYLGSETGYTFGHWYYYNGAWTDGGAYGAKGDKGDDGFSPTASVSKSGTTTTITITDENGTTTAEVEDGVAPEEMIAENVSDWLDENITEPTGVVIDTSLQVAGAAADSKKVGDEITDLKNAIQSLSSIPTAVKQAMDTLFQNVAFKNDDVYTSELATFHSWATDVNLLSITATFTQTKSYYTSDNGDLTRLKGDLVVTASYDDGTSTTITTYTLSGTLAVGTSVITATYDGKSATFNVTVSEGFYYTPSAGLLSAQSYVTATESGTISPSAFVESVIDDYLKIYYPKTSGSSSWANYSFSPSQETITSYGRFKAELKIVSCGYISATNTTSKGQFALALPTGNSDGAFCGFIRSVSNSNPVKVRYTNSSTVSYGGDVSTDSWHTVEVIIENNAQTLKIDGTAVLTNDTLGTGSFSAASKIAVTLSALNSGAVEVHIRSLEFETDASPTVEE